MILIDASALIEFLNRTGSRADLLIEQLVQHGADIALADVTITEVLQGIKNDREHGDVKAFLLTYPTVSLQGVASYVAAGELYRSCRKKGFTVRSTVDLLIAQIALEGGLSLLHNDRDFDSLAQVCDLKIHGGSH